MSAPRNDPRSLAVSSLVRIEKSGRYSNLEVDSAIGSSSLSDADKRLYSRLVYGVLERKITLDFVIARFSKISPEKLDPECRAALRLGLYQLAFSDRIPDHAAVSGTVNAVRERYRGYVNGVLRSFIRGGKKIDPPESDDPLVRASVAHSVSADICSVLYDSYGRDAAESILSSFSGEAPVTLRLNTLVSDPFDGALLPPDCEPADGALRGIAAFVRTVSPEVRRGIDEGLWFVENSSSILCAEILGAVPGDTVADVCSAPGGKTFSSSIRMKNRGTVRAFDLHENKLSLVTSGAARLGIDIVSVEKRDGRTPDEALFGKCERVLCDVPCSGIGVMGKKPEIRYKTAGEISPLPAIQRDILLSSARYCAPGGTLVYSTCTLNRKENEEVASYLPDADPNFSALDFEIPRIGSSRDGMLTVFPGSGGLHTDGFFIAAFRRSGVN